MHIAMSFYAITVKFALWDIMVNRVNSLSKINKYPNYIIFVILLLFDSINNFWNDHLL